MITVLVSQMELELIKIRITYHWPATGQIMYLMLLHVMYIEWYIDNTACYIEVKGIA